MGDGHRGVFVVAQQRRLSGSVETKAWNANTSGVAMYQTVHGRNSFSVDNRIRMMYRQTISGTTLLHAVACMLCCCPLTYAQKHRQDTFPLFCILIPMSSLLRCTGAAAPSVQPSRLIGFVVRGLQCFVVHCHYDKVVVQRTVIHIGISEIESVKEDAFRSCTTKIVALTGITLQKMLNIPYPPYVHFCSVVPLQHYSCTTRF